MVLVRPRLGGVEQEAMVVVSAEARDGDQWRPRHHCHSGGIESESVHDVCSTVLGHDCDQSGLMAQRRICVAPVRNLNRRQQFWMMQMKQVVWLIQRRDGRQEALRQCEVHDVWMHRLHAAV